MDVPGGARRVQVLRVAGLAILLGLIVLVRLVAVAEVDWRADPAWLLYGIVAPAAYLVPGVILLLRRSWHVVGWLLCTMAVGMAFSFGSDWGALRFGGAWMIWALNAFEGSLFWLPMIALLVVFPDGLAARPRPQRVTGRVIIAVAAVAVVLELLVDQVPLEGGRAVANPLPVAVVPTGVADDLIIVTFVALAAAFAGMVRRYRSSTRIMRRQYLWVLSALVFLVGALAVGIAGSVLAGYDDGPWWLPILVGYVLLPVAFMIAILRYRLYEIDRLITRTVTYSVVVALLGLLYLGAVALLTRVLPASNNVAVATSTLVAAAVVRPLQQGVQRRVDRRFNRPRFDAEQEVADFVRRLRDQTDLAVVETELRAVIDRTLRPASSLVWIPAGDARPQALSSRTSRASERP